MTKIKYDEKKEYLLEDTHTLTTIGNKKIVKYSSEIIMEVLLDGSKNADEKKAKYVSTFFLLPPIKGDAGIVFGYHTFSEDYKGVETKMIGELEISAISKTQKLVNLVT